MQHGLGAASIGGEIFLILIFVWLLYDIVTGYLARRRFAKLMALKSFWLRDCRSQIAVAHLAGKSNAPSGSLKRRTAAPR